MKRSEFNGILIINKPSNWTSHDVVARVRSIFGVKKVGHAGTLDPLATGVLVVMVGREATKLSDKLRTQDKEYLISLEFGRATDTGDADGKVIKELKAGDLVLQRLSKDRLEEVLDKFKGEIEQVVPWYSAIKVGGKKLYEIARNRKREGGGWKVEGGDEGRSWKMEEPVGRPKRKVKIYEVELLEFQQGKMVNSPFPQAKIRAVVGSGTYTRSLVEDIGKALGVPAYQTALVRTRVGKYGLDQAVAVKTLIAVSNPASFLRALTVFP